MFQKLFTPQKIGKLTIPNRLVVPAMVTNFCDSDGNATERYIAYHEAKARGGFGLVITEDYAISPEGRGFPYVAGLWNDSQIASHAKLPERVHAAGGLVFAQIYHCGRQTNEASNGGLPVIAPSPIRDPRKHSDPKEMTTEDIRRVVRQFGETAARAKMAGFDGIELHGGHGYLLSQFMSSYSNKRVDEYGGGFLGRMRIVREVIEEVRSQVGGDYPIIFRISTKEYMPGGRDREDTRAAAVYLERWGVDALHVSVGTYGDNTNIVPIYVSHGWIVDYA